MRTEACEETDVILSTLRISLRIVFRDLPNLTLTSCLTFNLNLVSLYCISQKVRRSCDLGNDGGPGWHSDYMLYTIPRFDWVEI